MISQRNVVPLSLIALSLAACGKSADTPDAPLKPTGATPAPSARHTTTDRDGLDTSQYFARFGDLSTDALVAESKNIRDLLTRYPDQAAEILALFTGFLASHDPGIAVDFVVDHAEMIPGAGPARSLASGYLQAWNEDDPGALVSYLQPLFILQENHEHRSEAILSLLITPTTEGTLETGKWLGWMHTLSPSDAETTDLQAAALDRLLKLSDPETSGDFAAVIEAYQNRLSDPAMQKHLGDYTSIIAHHFPESTRAVLEQIPPGSYRDEILERVMSDLGREHPEIAADWLSSPEILDEIFRPQTDDLLASARAHNATGEQIEAALSAYNSEADTIYDRALQAYIFSLVDRHPEDAIQTVEAITDPARRAALREQIEKLVAADAAFETGHAPRVGAFPSPHSVPR